MLYLFPGALSIKVIIQLYFIFISVSFKLVFFVPFQLLKGFILELYSEPELQETRLPLEFIYFTLCDFNIFRFFFNNASFTRQLLQNSFHKKWARYTANISWIC